MTNPSWGTKRSCLSCNTHFYDLNKVPAVCPKCKHEFDPAVAVRAKRKPARREASDAKKDIATGSVLASKKPIVRKKDKDSDADGGDGGISDIAEMDDVDDIESLRELSELEERENTPVIEDDANEEAIIEEMDTGDKTLVESVEDEEASALVNELDDEEAEISPKAKASGKKKTK